jgi:hypothetical protein
MDNVKCRGDEQSIVDCPHDDDDDCNELEGAGVVCDSVGFVSPSTLNILSTTLNGHIVQTTTTTPPPTRKYILMLKSLTIKDLVFELKSIKGQTFKKECENIIFIWSLI